MAIAAGAVAHVAYGSEAGDRFASSDFDGVVNRVFYGRYVEADSGLSNFEVSCQFFDVATGRAFFGYFDRFFAIYGDYGDGATVYAAVVFTGGSVLDSVGRATD